MQPVLSEHVNKNKTSNTILPLPADKLSKNRWGFMLQKEKLNAGLLKDTKCILCTFVAQSTNNMFALKLNYT